METQYAFNKYEQALAFGRKVEIIGRFMEWGLENQQLVLAADLTDAWTPKQRDKFFKDWQNDMALQQINDEFDLTHQWPTQDKSFISDWQDDDVLLVSWPEQIYRPYK